MEFIGELMPLSPVELLGVFSATDHGFFVELIRLFGKWSRSCGVIATDHGGIVNEFFVEARASVGVEHGVDEFFAVVKGVGDVLAGV